MKILYFLELGILLLIPSVVTQSTLWTQWSVCSKTCPIGTKSRQRIEDGQLRQDVRFCGTAKLCPDTYSTTTAIVDNSEVTEVIDTSRTTITSTLVTLVIGIVVLIFVIGFICLCRRKLQRMMYLPRSETNRTNDAVEADYPPNSSIQTGENELPPSYDMIQSRQYTQQEFHPLHPVPPSADENTPIGLTGSQPLPEYQSVNTEPPSGDAPSGPTGSQSPPGYRSLNTAPPSGDEDAPGGTTESQPPPGYQSVNTAPPSGETASLPTDTDPPPEYPGHTVDS